MSASKSNSEKHAASPPEGFYLGQQKRQYLIASRTVVPGLGLSWAGPQQAALQLKGLGIEFEAVKTLHGRSAAASLPAFALGPAKGPDILVARLDPEQGEALRRQSASGLGPLTIEEDSPLSYGAAPSLEQTLMAGASAVRVDRSSLKPCPVRFQVLGEGDKPLPRVAVSVYGAGLPTEGITDENGQADLSFYALQPGHAEAVLAKPRKDYWDFLIRDVELRLDGPNLIRLRSFTETLPRYKAGPFLSWGQEFMMHNQLDASLDGKGVKIAIIDSGCDNTHPSLQHITSGTDVLDGGQSLGWTLDQLGHGTHCAGIIAAKPARGFSMHGFAPAADIHIFKVFSGGRFSDLICALDHCIDEGVDIVNLSLGAGEVSLLVEQKIQEARQHGIGCIVAAGNSWGDINYPAKSPYVLAVTAIGHQSEFPMDSTHALTITRMRTPDGTFSPNFTCHGPQTGVCAPGVAIISTVPGAGLDAMDGTSMAAAHVTGLAGLLLAHHPLFKSGLGKERSAARVQALFNLIRQNCAALPFGDRAGAGLPVLAICNLAAFTCPAGFPLPVMPQNLMAQPNYPLFQPSVPGPAGSQPATTLLSGGLPMLQ